MLQQCTTHCSDLVCTKNHSCALSHGFNEKSAIWKCGGYSSAYSMFSPLAIRNPSPFCSPLPQSEARLQPCTRLAIPLFLVGSCSYLYVHQLSLHWFRVAVFSQQDSWGMSRIFSSAVIYSKKYFEKQDQGKPERQDVFLQQLQQSLNFLKTLL